MRVLKKLHLTAFWAFLLFLLFEVFKILSILFLELMTINFLCNGCYHGKKKMFCVCFHRSMHIILLSSLITVNYITTVYFTKMVLLSELRQESRLAEQLILPHHSEQAPNHHQHSSSSSARAITTI